MGERMSRCAEMRTEGHLGQPGKDPERQVEKWDSMLQRETLEALEGGRRVLRGAQTVPSLG